MKVRWGRLAVGILAAELLLILSLVALVAILGPKEPGAAEEFAQKLGRWVGPIGGALVSLLGALWVSRPLERGHVRHGVLLGLGLALLDAGLLAASQAPFEWIFVGSNLGKIVAGYLGGALAGQGRN